MTGVLPAQAGSSASRDRSVGPSAPDRARQALNVRCGLDDGNDVALGHVRRPTWRGAVHAIGLVAAVPAVSALLVSSTGTPRFRLSLFVYAVGLCLMLAVSATYHRWVHGLRARCAWRRVDHAGVFAAIAGSSTPIVVAALPGVTGFVLVGTVWSAALVGAWCKLSHWGGGDRAGTAMYAVTIASGTVAVPWLGARDGIGPAALLVAGGAVYLVGAACFAKQWPTLRPTVFSYHEVWHVLTIIAAVAQFVAIWMLAT